MYTQNTCLHFVIQEQIDTFVYFFSIKISTNVLVSFELLIKEKRINEHPAKGEFNSFYSNKYFIAFNLFNAIFCIFFLILEWMLKHQITKFIRGVNYNFPNVLYAKLL